MTNLTVSQKFELQKLHSSYWSCNTWSVYFPIFRVFQSESQCWQSTPIEECWQIMNKEKQNKCSFCFYVFKKENIPESKMVWSSCLPAWIYLCLYYSWPGNKIIILKVNKHFLDVYLFNPENGFKTTTVDIDEFTIIVLSISKGDGPVCHSS
jgi:hypothetical protein